MEVAVSVYRYGLFAADGEFRLGGFAGEEGLALDALCGFKADPFDAVLFAHGMGDGTNADFYFALGYGYYGKMLFLAGFNGIGGELLHFFTAADNGYAGALEEGYYVSTMAADVEFRCVHDKFSFKLNILFCLPAFIRLSVFLC